MKMEFEYYRIPDTITKPPPKGRPHRDWLHLYIRGGGWQTLVFASTIKPNSKGGCTVCKITINGNTYTERAYCSHSDNFCYKRGRDISLGRAIKLYQQEVT